MQRFFVLALALFTFLVAPQVPGLRTAQAATVKAQPKSDPLSLLFGEEEPVAKPVIECVKGKKCVPTYRLNDEVSAKSSKEIIAWIAAAEDAHADAFVLEINTPGGSVPDGFEVSKKIENAKLPITCVVDGEASSMGFYILQSCPTRMMTKRSTLMAHEPALGGMFHGQPNQWDAMAMALKALRAAMAEHCNHRLTTTIKEYRARTDGSLMWWFNWNDAVKYHAIDKVAVSVQAVIKSLS